MDRYGATSDDPRIDPTFSLEGYADPARIIGPIRAITTIPTVVTGPFSIGADTGCANALFRVTGGIHATTVLGIGICPPNSIAGNAWINNQLVVGTDPTGGNTLRVGGNAKIQTAGGASDSSSALFVNSSSSFTGLAINAPTGQDVFVEFMQNSAKTGGITLQGSG